MLIVVGDVEVRIQVSAPDDATESPRQVPEQAQDPRQPAVDPAEGDLPYTGLATSLLFMVAVVAIAVSRMLRPAFRATWEST